MPATLKSLPLILIVTAVFSPSFARQSPEKSLATHSVVVNVLDKQGNAVCDLTKEDFQFRLNGTPVTVVDARYSLAPRRVLVLFDISPSMGEEHSTAKWQIAREALDDLLKQKPGEAPIAMLTFASEVRDVFDFSQGGTAIAKWLNEAPDQLRQPKRQGRRTALFDAILKGLKLLEPLRPGDALYVITDGRDNASHVSPSQARALLLKSGVRLFAFLLVDYPPNAVGIGGESAYSFREMARDSGGFAFDLAAQSGTFLGAPLHSGCVFDDANREKVKEYTQQLNIQVYGFWTLDLMVAPTSKQEKVSLKVVGHEGKARKDVWLTYSRLLPGEH